MSFDWLAVLLVEVHDIANSAVSGGDWPTAPTISRIAWSWALLDAAETQPALRRTPREIAGLSVWEIMQLGDHLTAMADARYHAILAWDVTCGGALRDTRTQPVVRRGLDARGPVICANELRATLAHSILRGSNDAD